VLHFDEVLGVAFLDAVDGAHVGEVQRGHSLRLVGEPRLLIRCSGEALEGNFSATMRSSRMSHAL
jgi:hypothetical protein